jgi:hypothetical protein
MNTQKSEYDQTRERLARIIHDSWSVEPFHPELHSEDWAAADAVLAAFPHIVRPCMDEGDLVVTPT